MADNYRSANVTDTQGFYEYSLYINEVAGGLFFPIIIFIIWVIVFIATKRFSASQAWTYASFISMILSIILATLDLMTATIMYLFIFMTAVGFVWLKLESSSGR